MNWQLAGMMYVQVAYGAMFLVTRFALTRGMSHYAFVLYRQIIAALILLPLAFYFQRNTRVVFTLRSFGHIFLLALMGISICQNMYYAGLAYTSSTFLSTMNNLQPAITFLLAYLLRLEEMRIESRRGQAKVIGTLLGVGGAIVMTVFKNNQNNNAQDLVQAGSFLLGALLTISGTLSWSVFLIYQAWIVEEYSSQLMLSAQVSLMASLQCAAISLLLENTAALRLHWDIQLLTIAYSGVFCAGFAVFIIMWCVKEKGPVYATAFNPVSTLLVAILEPLLLHVQLTWTSLTGIVMVIGGLYLFLWGKSQESNVQDSTAVQQLLNANEGKLLNANEQESSSQHPLLA